MPGAGTSPGYGHRPEEAAALVLTVVFLGVLGFARRSPPAPPRPLPLLPIALLLAAYAASHAVMPPIIRAAVAVAATLFCFYHAAFRERPPVAFWGLVALALPVLPSLQFMLGYPMRIVSAAIAVVLLQAHGLVVARQGTFLIWRDEMVQFDAPCSGVNMLWAGLLLTLMGCVWLRLGAIKVVVAVALSIVLAIACNVLRAVEPVLCRSRARAARTGVVARRHRHRRLHAVGRGDALAAAASARSGDAAMRRMTLARANPRGALAVFLLAALAAALAPLLAGGNGGRDAPPTGIFPAGPPTTRAAR